jgi:hypothetical protein
MLSGVPLLLIVQSLPAPIQARKRVSRLRRILLLLLLLTIHRRRRTGPTTHHPLRGHKASRWASSAAPIHHHHRHLWVGRPRWWLHRQVRRSIRLPRDPVASTSTSSSICLWKPTPASHHHHRGRRHGAPGTWLLGGHVRSGRSGGGGRLLLRCKDRERILDQRASQHHCRRSRAGRRSSAGQGLLSICRIRRRRRSSSSCKVSKVIMVGSCVWTSTHEGKRAATAGGDNIRCGCHCWCRRGWSSSRHRGSSHKRAEMLPIICLWCGSCRQGGEGGGSARVTATDEIGASIGLASLIHEGKVARTPRGWPGSGMADIGVVMRSPRCRRRGLCEIRIKIKKVRHWRRRRFDKTRRKVASPLLLLLLRGWDGVQAP